jgi:hypothetical protein
MLPPGRRLAEQLSLREEPKESTNQSCRKSDPGEKVAQDGDQTGEMGVGGHAAALPF